VKIAGLVAALAATVVFASRDNLVRWLADDSDTTVQPALAAATTLTAGSLVVAGSLLVRGGPLRVRDLPSFVPAGICFGLSYVCLFEAYYRGPVSVVSPLVATESLWGVTLSAVFLRRHELVGPRLIAGAVLVVLGGALIGAAR
jgi:drug/metabolite transporter (DMT)-like permease